MTKGNISRKIKLFSSLLWGFSAIHIFTKQRSVHWVKHLILNWIRYCLFNGKGMFFHLFFIKFKCPGVMLSILQKHIKIIKILKGVNYHIIRFRKKHTIYKVTAFSSSGIRSVSGKSEDPALKLWSRQIRPCHHGVLCVTQFYPWQFLK